MTENLISGFIGVRSNVSAGLFPHCFLTSPSYLLLLLFLFLLLLLSAPPLCSSSPPAITVT